MYSCNVGLCALMATLRKPYVWETKYNTILLQTATLFGRGFVMVLAVAYAGLAGSGMLKGCGERNTTQHQQERALAATSTGPVKALNADHVDAAWRHSTTTQNYHAPACSTTGNGLPCLAVLGSISSVYIAQLVRVMSAPGIKNGLRNVVFKWCRLPIGICDPSAMFCPVAFHLARCCRCTALRCLGRATKRYSCTASRHLSSACLSQCAW